jgi:hypothetical protein
MKSKNIPAIVISAVSLAVHGRAAQDRLTLKAPNGVALRDNLDATLAAANSPTGAVYPPGSVIQLVPGEAMVKRDKGFNPATRDWEFFELDVSKDGTQIRKRGFADVVNRFGGNCFGCHVAARPEWDLVCEADHSCAPIPVTRAMIGALQRTDPRCDNPALSPEDAEALGQLNELAGEPRRRGAARSEQAHGLDRARRPSG